MQETFKSILRKHIVNRYGGCAYLYRNGIAIAWQEEYKGKTLYFNAWHECEISFNDDTLHRVVLHNASILAFGIPSGVRGYPNNSSEATKKAGLSIRTIEVVWPNGAIIRDDELVGMLSADMVGQGTGEWSDRFGLCAPGKEYKPEYDDIIAA